MSVTANEKVVCLLNMGYIYRYVVAAESWRIKAECRYGFAAVDK